MSTKSESKEKQNSDGMQNTPVSPSYSKITTPIDIEFNDLTYTVPHGRKGTII